MNKRLCVLQITPSKPNPDHVMQFSNQEECDFYFVTHDENHPDALKFCPNTTYIETKNILIDLVPKNYDYYAFIDYDYEFESKTDLSVLDQLIKDLDHLNPAFLIPHSGRNIIHGGINHPSSDESHFNSKRYSVQAFTHFGCKIIHKSLIDYFFPLPTNFGFAFGGCHLFNILEIPLLEYSAVTHNLIYHNSKYETGNRYEKDDLEMVKLWQWISDGILEEVKIQSPFAKLSPLSVKHHFVELFKSKNLSPEPKAKNKNWLDEELISKFFDLDHPFFVNKNLFLKKVSINHSDLQTQDNPWEKLTDLPPQDSVHLLQNNLNSSAFYINSGKFDCDFNSFIEGKTVALVGPSPHIEGKKLGKKIDDCDVVVRVNHVISNTDDYGKKTNVIVSNFNPCYGPKLKNHLESLNSRDYPSYLMSSDSVAELKATGNPNNDEDWISVNEVYDKEFKKFGIPLYSLQDDLSKKYTHRWHLYWEIFPKDFAEDHGQGSFTQYTANFNSGYGALNMLMRCNLKSLYFTGIDFYNLGVPQASRERYSDKYVRTFGEDDTSAYGLSPILHDQLSQIMHFKNVLLKNRSNIELEKDFEKKINSSDTDLRINKYRKLPKISRNHTR